METTYDSNSVLPFIRYLLMTTIGLSFMSHFSAIWMAIEECIEEDVYHQRNSSLLNLQLMLFSNKYTKIRSTLLLLLLIHCILPFIGLFALNQDSALLLIIYSIFMLILFIIELKCLSNYVRFLSIFFHYFATLLTFLYLLSKKYNLVQK